MNINTQNLKEQIIEALDIQMYITQSESTCLMEERIGTNNKVRERYNRIIDTKIEKIGVIEEEIKRLKQIK